ncbi:MAG: gluconate 2-dehydrogenase subunit 3 family protein [Bryobacteraceae bacterium]
MSESGDRSRREWLRHIAMSLSLGTAGSCVLSAQDAHRVHGAVAADKAAANGPYVPKALTAHEFATLERLSGLILPADEHSPGALAAGAAQFIDFLCSASDEMKRIYTGGLAWLDDAIRRRNDGETFVGAAPERQTALLDAIAWRGSAPGGMEAGVEFFDWARKMVADAFYTSPIGIRDLGYRGNRAVSEFHVPREAIEYAVKRSPFA